MFRPGLQVLRRDSRSLQFGLDWPGVVTVTATPALDAVLRVVDGFLDTAAVVSAAISTADVDVAEVSATLDLLVDCGIVVDQATTAEPVTDRATWGATWLLAGPRRDGRDLHRRRLRTPVHVDGTGRVAEAARRQLDDAGLTVLPDRHGADVTLFASDHEPDRSAGDAPMREEHPHLWVYVRELVGVVGPFVSPGATACLRCLDRARSEIDPGWPTLISSATSRRPSAPACDRVLASLVGTWGVQEVALWAMGLRPHTWGGMIEVPQAFGRVQSETFAPHPHCGCGWPIWHDTMGA